MMINKDDLMYSAYRLIPLIEEVQSRNPETEKDYIEKTSEMIKSAKPLLEEMISENKDHEKNEMWEYTLNEINNFLDSK